MGLSGGASGGKCGVVGGATGGSDNDEDGGDGDDGSEDGGEGGVRGGEVVGIGYSGLVLAGTVCEPNFTEETHRIKADRARSRTAPPHLQRQQRPSAGEV